MRRDHPAVPPADALIGQPATVGEWRQLSGPDLIDAMMRATWHAYFNDTLGDWAVMPIALPPSSGAPPVGCFIAEPIARAIAADHNTNLPPSGEHQ